MVTIGAVIFDFNGVLLWDTKLHDNAWRTFSVKYRGSPLTEKELVENVHGRPNKDVQEYIIGRSVTSKEYKQFLEEKEKLYKNACLAWGPEFALSPGSIDFFNYLNEKGIPFTIATSSEIGNVRFFFEYLKLATWFGMETIVFDDGTYPGKPAPDIYLKAAERIGTPPAECLVVEDAKSGLQAAQSAGIGCIVALGPKKRHAELLKVPGVTLTIEKIDELMQIGPLASLPETH